MTKTTVREPKRNSASEREFPLPPVTTYLITTLFYTATGRHPGSRDRNTSSREEPSVGAGNSRTEIAMKPNVIPFPIALGAAANDDPPTGPGGSSVSAFALRRCTSMIRTLRGVALRSGGIGQARAA